MSQGNQGTRPNGVRSDADAVSGESKREKDQSPAGADLEELGAAWDLGLASGEFMDADEAFSELWKRLDAVLGSGS